MEQQVIHTEQMIESRIDRRIVSPRLRKITGWALLAASAGTFFDAYARAWFTSLIGPMALSILDEN